jgi:hypothetical protein
MKLNICVLAVHGFRLMARSYWKRKYENLLKDLRDAKRKFKGVANATIATNKLQSLGECRAYHHHSTRYENLY